MAAQRYLKQLGIEGSRGILNTDEVVAQELGPQHTIPIALTLEQLRDMSHVRQLLPANV